MIIELSERIIPATLREQAAKVVEEWDELNEAQVNDVSLDHVAEEAFDLMEALVRYLRMLGVDIYEANRRHLEKMRERELHGKAS